MDPQACEAGVDIGRQRKFGLPSWMTNNMERLNYATDFEEYACSPPENEGFLSECMENQVKTRTDKELSQISEHAGDIHYRNRLNIDEAENVPLHPPRSIHPISPPYPSRFCDRRQEDLFSSPDSTPCATPEPSPVIRRKLSVPHPDDTVQTNPGRWFYMGYKKPSSKLRSIDCEDSKMDPIIKPKKTAIKLAITNFDLNAVSPNSW